MADPIVNAQAQLLSVPALFDDAMATRITTTYTDKLAKYVQRVGSAVGELRVRGLLTPVHELWRVAEPIRSELRAKLAADNPALYEQVAAMFADQASADLRQALDRVLGPYGRRVQVAVARAIAEGDGSFEELRRVVGSIAERPADILSAERLLRQHPESEHRDAALGFLADLRRMQR